MISRAELITKAQAYIQLLCSTYPNRSVGRPVNRQATDYFKQVMIKNNFKTISQSFDCLEWYEESASLKVRNENFAVKVSPYTLGCQVKANLVAASTMSALEQLDARDKVLLLHGAITQEQLMPKKFVFYNPEKHQLIYRLLEEKAPTAIITATGKNPELAGSMYPFPMIEDGDFDIPSVYMKDRDGERLLTCVGETVDLTINSTRAAANGSNIVVSKGQNKSRRVVVCAHIDTKDNTPGALDNGSGIVVLMLLAQLLADYHDDLTIELVALNGEDYYSAPGQMTYLKSKQGLFNEISLAINMDGAGYIGNKTAYSFYGVGDQLQSMINESMVDQPNLILGESWHQSDHMIFAMNKVPAMAITSHGFMKTLSSTITHTPLDKADLVDGEKLVDIAQAIERIVRKLN